MSANTTIQYDLPRLLKCSIGVAFTLGILVEGLIIFVALIRSKKYLARPTLIFLLNLAAVDLLTGIFIVPPLTVIEISAQSRIFNRFFYLYWLTIGGLLWNARILALVSVALDRYLAICHPIRYSNLLTFSRARLGLILAWGLALALLLPQLAIFTTELVGLPRNVTEAPIQPYDWSYTTSSASRGILVFMFFIRFVFPITVTFVIDVLALRIVIESSSGFRQGVLRVKEPDADKKNIEKHNMHPNNSRRPKAIRNKRPILMRIHRGNYMTEGTKELFAQLPGTNRSLGRRTAVLPNLSLTSTTHSSESDSKSLSNNNVETNRPGPQGGDKERTPAPVRKAVISFPDGEKSLECENANQESQSQRRVAWWRSSETVSRFKLHRKKLKDLGSLIPFTILLAVFVLFSLPYQCLQVLKALWSKFSLPSEVIAHLYWLACANALVNPVILTFWSSACRAKVLHLISCGRFHHKQAAIKRLIIASFGTANLPYGRQVHPQLNSE
nr:Amine G protein-coupled receptor [Hymenolepis microstoma]